MTSPAANALAPPLNDDLSWPLSSYFISSSHNTYLTGNQLYSDSSTDAYKNVLLRACRCIEVDVWDGDESDSGTSSSSSSDSDSSDEELAQKKALKKQTHKERLAKKLPGSITSRLEHTSLGKKLEKYTSTESILASSGVAGSTPGATSGATSGATPTGTPPVGTPPVGDGASAVSGDSNSLKRTASSVDNSLKRTASPMEPRVLHGYTLTKEVSFRSVCKVIKENAFAVTDLPLIVSLEVHCSAEQQEAMVNIMDEEWAEYLLPPPPADARVLPSPEELRRKILVKVKYAPSGQKATATATPPGGPPAAGSAAPVKPSKIIQALSRLGIYTRGVSFKSLSQPEAQMPTHVFSLSESGVMEVHEKQGPELFRHNQNFLMRTYPSGMRIGSSNLDPPIFWRKGIQIVALNWQRWDEGMMLNEGMFAGTGGYMLKPEGYRGKKPVATTDGAPPVTTTGQIISAPLAAPEEVILRLLDLKITVLAAQNIPLPKGDEKPAKLKPYVKVELHTEPHNADAGKSQQSAKAKEGEHKARSKTMKGINPDYKSEVLEFKQVERVVPDLAFVRFLIKDDEIGRDSLAAWACIRLDRLRSGYRFIKLLDSEGVESKGVLLVKIEKKLS